MFSFFKKRKALKDAGELAQAARKLIRINRDILDPRRVTEMAGLCDTLQAAIKARDFDRVAEGTRRLDALLSKVFPRPKQAGLRENVEVFLVAGIVAMAVRTFFIQPFKIPTGSMQPTLYGIYPYRDEQRRDPPLPYPDGPPSIAAQIFGRLFLGRIYEPDGYRSRGDHIFVDRFSYHFRKPTRGDVIVFATDFMRERGFDPRGGFYIKRAVAHGGDHVEITPPYLRVNGEILDHRLAFKRIYSLRDGYNGYVLPERYGFNPAKFLNRENPENDVPPNTWLVLGDNSVSSLDGRFWGTVPQKAVVGRAIFVYWPFSKRFGLVD